MLKRGTIAVALVVSAWLAFALVTRRPNEIESPAARDDGPPRPAPRGEGRGEGPLEREVEREVEVEPEAAPEDESTRTERRLAALRQDVRLLEMQRLDAHERGDHETEARLDREIAAARAEHDRARGIGGPEGI